MQLVLDLLEASQPPVDPVSPKNAKIPSANRSPEAIDNIVTGSPVTPLDQAVAPTHFVHPQANREIALAGSRVAYELRRVKRRSIGLVVSPQGLVVSAPRWVPLGEVDAAIGLKAAWVLRKLTQARDRAVQEAQAHIEWREGALLPYLGEPVCLRFDPGHRFAAVGACLDDTPAEPGGARVLRLALAESADSHQIRDAVLAWLMRQARDLFIQRLDHFAPGMGVRWKRLSLSNAASRWGSARADGSIRLNWRLIHYRMPLVDYVVVHELAHLREMNHSQAFWDTVGQALPDYATHRNALKQAVVPRWS